MLRRPAVTVSNNGADTTAERFGRGVVTVVPLTSNVERIYPFQVLLPAAETGLAMALRRSMEDALRAHMALKMSLSGRSRRSAGSRGRPTNGRPSPSRPPRTRAPRRRPRPPSPAVQRPPEVGTAGRVGRRSRGRHVGVLDRVQVDRAAVRVLRPARRALDVATVERGRVVGLDRAEVARAVGIDRDHAPNREPRRVEPAENAEHRTGDVAVDDEPPGVHTRVEAPMARAHQPEVVKRRQGNRGARRAPSSSPEGTREAAPPIPGREASHRAATASAPPGGARRAPPRRSTPSARIGVAGFEPTTSRSQSGRSTRLSYTPCGGSLRPATPGSSRATRHDADSLAR